MKVKATTNILFMFLFLIVSIISQDNLCISKRLNQTEEINQIREASRSSKGKYFVLIFGSKCLLYYLGESQDFKDVKTFTDYLNANFNTVLEITLYCSNEYNPGFNLILIENDAILAENQVKHISRDYLKKLFEKNNINKTIQSQCND
jgi:thioredoxin-related protein